MQATGAETLGTFAVEDIKMLCFRVQLCTSSAISFGSADTSLFLFSYRTFPQWALKTIKICRQSAMCLVVPALASHVTHPSIKLACITHLWNKRGKREDGCAERPRSKQGTIWNSTFLLATIRRIKSFPSLYTRNTQVSEITLTAPLNKSGPDSFHVTA